MHTETISNRACLTYGALGFGITVCGLSALYGRHWLGSLTWNVATAIFMTIELLTNKQLGLYGHNDSSDKVSGLFNSRTDHTVGVNRWYNATYLSDQ